MDVSARPEGVNFGEMHSILVSSRALAAASALALASVAGAQAPTGPAQPRPPASKAPDAVLLEVGKGQIRGAVVASARAELPGGDAAILLAIQGRPKSPISFELLVVGSGEGGGYALLGHDEVKSAELFGAPVVALAAGAHPVAPRALTATVGWRAADGSAEAQTVVYRHGAGRLTRLLAVSPDRTFATGITRPAVRNELEVLPTSTGGFRDLRVRMRECAPGGECAVHEVASYTFDGVRYEARPHAIPFVEKIEASSALRSRGGMVDYSAAAAVDGRADTAWCEGAPGAGWFQKLELTFVPAQKLKALSILPGAGTGDDFREQTRPKRIRVVLPDKTKFEADLADEPRVQRVELPEWERVFGMTIVIVDVYKGKREDACITELDLEVEP